MNQQKDLYDKSYLVALRFLSHKPRTEDEVRKKIMSFWSRKKDDDSSNSGNLVVAVEAVIQTLLDEKFINDSDYVDSYLSYQAEVNKKSSRVLKNFLLSKGINKQLIDDKVTKDSVNDYVALDTLALKKYKILTLKSLPKMKVKQKLATYLLGKGFQFDDVFNAVDRVMGVK